MYARQLSPGEVFRVVGKGSIFRYRGNGAYGMPYAFNAINLETGYSAGFGPLVEVELIDYEPKEKVEICRRCGFRTVVSNLVRSETYDHTRNLTMFIFECTNKDACDKRQDGKLYMWGRFN